MPVMADRVPPAAGRRYALAFVLFFSSGAAGLIYQVAWSRMLSLVIGVTILAITTVVCTFMAGLGLGAWVFGRHARRWGDPLRLYGLVEAGIGAYALLTPLLFHWVQELYGSLSGEWGELQLIFARVVISAAVLIVPTTLMGGTLPLLSRAVSEQGDGKDAARDVGRLYAVNTIGAVVGCLGAGFFLLGELGIRSSLFVAAMLNLAIAAVAIAATRGRDAETAPVSERPAAPADSSTTVIDPTRFDGRMLVLVALFFSGFAALGYEVLWTRALQVYLRTSTYAFSLMLAVYLLGIALGSFAASAPASRSRRPLFGIALCQLGVAASAVLSLAAFPYVEELAFALLGIDRIHTFAQAVALMFGQAALVMLLPTLFMGATFPFGVAAYHRSSEGVEQSVGVLYATNTLGNIAGALVVGFGTISLIGVRHSLVLMVAIDLLVVAMIGARLAPTAVRKVAWGLASVAALAATHIGLSQQIFFDSMKMRPIEEIVYYREGASDTIFVTETRGMKRHRTLIYADGRGAAGTWTLRWNLYLGHLPMLLHPDPQEVLHICFGSGNSVLALTRHDPERIDAVELSPHVRETAEWFWTNENVLEHPKVHLIIDDGRNHLLRTRRSYDVISMEPPTIHAAGVVNLYTREFYTLAHGRLNEGGMVMQWLPTGSMPTDDRARLIRTFTDSFPHSYLFQELDSTQLLIIGTLEPLQVDVDAIDRRLSSEAVVADAAIMETPTGAELLSYFLLGDASTRRLGASHQAVTDDRTIVDYTIPLDMDSGFGLDYMHPLGDEGYSHQQVTLDRLREYAEWQDPVSLIVPDAAQARRVELAIAKRRESPRRTKEMRRKLRALKRQQE